ncbi:MAG: hypothetical protein C6I01_04600 [Epsilonproteobacteria bacterium]|nr:hypothetical protein [Campylobacterota bacterium]NPA89143.1 hypothetical protein [Campylobacterota bacterium]
MSRYLALILVMGGLVWGEDNTHLLAKAVLMEGENNLSEAVKLYNKLYNLSGDEEFLGKEVDLLIYRGEYKKAIELAKKGKSLELKKKLFKALVFADRLKEAEKLKNVVGKEYFYHLIISHLGGLNQTEKLKKYAYLHYLDTHSQEALKILVTTLWKLGEAEEAVTILKKHLAKYPNSKVAINLLGQIYRDLEAEDELIKLYTKYPTPQRLEMVAQYLWERGKYKKLEKWVKERKLPEIWKLRLYFVEGRLKDGYQIAQHLIGEGVELQFYKSYFAYRLKKENSPNREEELRELVATACQWGDRRGLELLLPYLVSQREFKLGEEVALTGLEAWEEDPYFLTYLGVIHSREGKCSDAVKEVNQVITTDQNLNRLIKEVKERCVNDIAKNN